MDAETADWHLVDRRAATRRTGLNARVAGMAKRSGQPQVCR